MRGVLSLTSFAIGEPAAHLAAASICKSFCAPRTQLGSRRPASANPTTYESNCCSSF
jgi:hypothetical protein